MTPSEALAIFAKLVGFPRIYGLTRNISCGTRLYVFSISRAPATHIGACFCLAVAMPERAKRKGRQGTATYVVSWIKVEYNVQSTTLIVQDGGTLEGLEGLILKLTIIVANNNLAALLLYLISAFSSSGYLDLKQ